MNINSKHFFFYLSFKLDHFMSFIRSLPKKHHKQQDTETPDIRLFVKFFIDHLRTHKKTGSSLIFEVYITFLFTTLQINYHRLIHLIIVHNIAITNISMDNRATM